MLAIVYVLALSYAHDDNDEEAYATREYRMLMNKKTEKKRNHVRPLFRIPLTFPYPHAILYLLLV